MGMFHTTEGGAGMETKPKTGAEEEGVGGRGNALGGAGVGRACDMARLFCLASHFCRRFSAGRLCTELQGIQTHWEIEWGASLGESTRDNGHNCRHAERI